MAAVWRRPLRLPIWNFMLWLAAGIGVVVGNEMVPTNPDDIATMLRDFAKLWEMVAVGHAARGVPMVDVPPVRQVCFYGIGAATFDVARFLLGEAEPPIQTIELHDIEGRMESLVAQLVAEFGASRVLAARDDEGGGHSAPRGDPGVLEAQVVAATTATVGVATDASVVGESWGRPSCDLAIISQDSALFSVERLLERSVGSRYAAVSWISLGCITEEGKTSTDECGFLHAFWENTLLLRRGYCIRNVCMSRVPIVDLHDPNSFSLDCEGLLGHRGGRTARSWTSPAAEFSQDWFFIANFLGELASDGGGIYVDVGANFPFEYSNTVVLDRCLGWQGLCIEPNPGLIPWLRAYRSCQVVNKCIAEERAPKRPFHGRDGELAFEVDCVSLDEILANAGLRGRRIDLLSIDVEHSELAVLKSLRLEDYDIRVMIIEVGRGARWLEVDTEVLRRGFAKVAVLGRDAVYVQTATLLRSRLQVQEHASWGAYTDSFLSGYALDDDTLRPLEESRIRCHQIGMECSGVTCSGVEADSMCSVRAGRRLWGSPVGEVSYLKVELPQILQRDKVVMPPSWAQYHQRVLDEELEQEMRTEREATIKGLRRPMR
eukprot:TRINITY_DN18772_c0_g1_i1.p1 TRINITY_DN18772_c0_g1~~TRINITY_DN18772_c0_g1_i1.p1  ORF type:complete len:603 (-),score=85.70 TRINITY_DN18772_c0_g1_i1:381-2189(-)